MECAAGFPPGFREFRVAAEMVCCLIDIWLSARAGLGGQPFINLAGRSRRHVEYGTGPKQVAPIRYQTNTRKGGKT